MNILDQAFVFSVENCGLPLVEKDLMEGIKTSFTAFKSIWRQVNFDFKKDSRLPMQKPRDHGWQRAVRKTSPR